MSASWMLSVLSKLVNESGWRAKLEGPRYARVSRMRYLPCKEKVLMLMNMLAKSANRQTEANTAKTASDSTFSRRSVPTQGSTFLIPRKCEREYCQAFKSSRFTWWISQFDSLNRSQLVSDASANAIQISATPEAAGAIIPCFERNFSKEVSCSAFTRFSPDVVAALSPAALPTYPAPRPTAARIEAPKACSQLAAKKATQFKASQASMQDISKPPARAHHSRSSSCSIWVSNPVSRTEASIITPSTMGITSTTNLCAITGCQRPTTISRGAIFNAQPDSRNAAGTATTSGATNDHSSRPQASFPLPLC